MKTDKSADNRKPRFAVDTGGKLVPFSCGAQLSLHDRRSTRTSPSEMAWRRLCLGGLQPIEMIWCNMDVMYVVPDAITQKALSPSSK